LSGPKPFEIGLDQGGCLLEMFFPFWSFVTTASSSSDILENWWLAGIMTTNFYKYFAVSAFSVPPPLLMTDDGSW